MHLSPRRQFTLVELITVIVIIMILMGILLPTVSIVIKKAEVNQTKVRMKTLIMAIKQYESQYGVLPAYNGNPGSAISSDHKMDQGGWNDGFISLLTNAKTASGHHGNVRGIRFLEPIDPADPNNYVDAWGQRFYIRVDTNYDGQINGDTSATDIHSVGGSLFTNVIVWSRGPDEETLSSDIPPSPSNANRVNEDNVNSWED